MESPSLYVAFFWDRPGCMYEEYYYCYYYYRIQLHYMTSRVHQVQVQLYLPAYHLLRSSSSY